MGNEEEKIIDDYDRLPMFYEDEHFIDDSKQRARDANLSLHPFVNY